MKKVSLIILCFSFIFLLWGCTFAQQQESSNSEKLSESSTVPSQSQENQGEESSQNSEESQALSYQEYFSTQRPFEAVEPFCTVFLGKEEEGGRPDSRRALSPGRGAGTPAAGGRGRLLFCGRNAIYYASGSCIYQLGLEEEEPQAVLEARGPLTF